MFKRFTIAMLMLGTLAVGNFALTSTADAQWVRRGWYGTSTPYYSYYAPRRYNYYVPRYYGRYSTPYRYYYSTPYVAPYYYGSRPGFQVYIR